MSNDPIIDNPYIGPRTFNRTDANLFFGREQEANDLRALILTERLVLFYAQSGAGKSSLINARLIPQLQQASFAVLPVGRVSGEVPEYVDQVDNIFIFNLLLNLDQRGTSLTQFSQMTLSYFLSHLASDDGEHYYYDPNPISESIEPDYQEPRHILIIDQFEEIVTTHLDRWSEREAFFRQLDQALIDDPLLWVVLTLREDYLASLEPYAPLFKDKMRARFYMRRLTREAAIEAVKKPAEEIAGRFFKAGVAETLVDNLRQVSAQNSIQKVYYGEFVEPVQLQIVCRELWERIKQEMDNEIYEYHLPLGHIEQALIHFYETAIDETAQATGQSEKNLRDWFGKQTITPNETRALIRRNENKTGTLPNEVIDLLEKQFLIRVIPRADQTWYELSHDRFIKPILQSNRNWQQAKNSRRLKLATIAMILTVPIVVFLTVVALPKILDPQANQRNQAYQQIEEGVEAQDYVAVIKASERFLSLSSGNQDERQQQVIDYYNEAIFLWFAKHKDDQLDGTDSDLLKRYQQLVIESRK